MNKEKKDLRSEVTKKFLSDAFLNLLKEKAFDQITVIDICQEANIHRTTFYKHYDDKYHLLDYILRSIREDLEKKHDASHTSHGHPHDCFLETFRYALEFFTEKKDIFSNILFKKGNEYVEFSLRHIIYSYLYDELLRSQERENVNFSVDLGLIAQYYSGGAMAVITWWFKNNYIYSIDEMVIYLGKLISDSFTPCNELSS